MGCNGSKKKENEAVRRWDAETGNAPGPGGSSGSRRGQGQAQAAGRGDNYSASKSLSHSASQPVGIGGAGQGSGHGSRQGAGDRRQQDDQQPVFEEEFILSTSTQNRLKEHELMNAIITRSAAEFVDVNQASDMLDDDDDPFEVSREFSAQVADATVRPRDRMAPQCLPAQSHLLNQPRAVVDVLAVRSVTTQERAEIDNIAFQLADAVSQVAPQDRGTDMVVKFEI